MAQRHLTGSFQLHGSTWWALCNEYPVATSGETQEEALSKVMEAVRTYVAASGVSVKRVDSTGFSVELTGELVPA